jgi:molybdopterin-binding protein
MNRIAAVITAIDSFDGINIVSFVADSQPMRMMALELNKRLQVGSKVILGVKASNIALAGGLKGVLSISNQLKVKIERVDNGELLSSVKFRFAGSLIESIITRDSSMRMNLRPGDEVVALIKSSELSILEVTV